MRSCVIDVWACVGVRSAHIGISFRSRDICVLAIQLVHRLLCESMRSSIGYTVRLPLHRIVSYRSGHVSSCHCCSDDAGSSSSAVKMDLDMYCIADYARMRITWQILKLPNEKWNFALQCLLLIFGLAPVDVFD